MNALSTSALLWSALALPMLGTNGEPVAFKVERKKGAIEFVHGGKVLARYEHGPEVAKPFFYPLATPGTGTIVTRGWPMVKGLPNESTDHPHQKSAWFCHGDVVPEGIELKQKIKGVEGVDFWSEVAGHGKIVCTKVDDVIVHDANHISIPTHNEWRTADGTKILDESRTIHLSLVNGSALWVLEIDLHASVCPITFADTKEGAMGVRVNDQFAGKAGKGTITNAGGKVGEKAVWGMQSDWCDYSGKVDGKLVGIALFDDPKNAARASWHSREYGLMAANPFGRGKSGFPAMKGKADMVKLAKGEHLKLRYGILVHDGDVEAAGVAKAYEAFRKQ